MNEEKDRTHIGWRALLLGIAVSAVFAWYTVYQEHAFKLILTATQIPVLPYVLLFAAVLLVNPVLRLVRVVRPFTAAELLLVFLMGAVSSGISTFGLASQLIPAVSGLSNGQWNNTQSRWDLHVEPFLPESYFLMPDGLQEASRRARKAELEWREAGDMLKAARAPLSARRQVERLQAEVAAIAPDTADARVLIHRRNLQQRLAAATRLGQEASAAWRERSSGVTPEEGERRGMEETQTLYAVLQTHRQELQKLHDPAFEATAIFRRGMPEGMRAIPGFLYVPGEGLDSYLYRLRRLRTGREALRELAVAKGALLQAIASRQPPGAEAVARLSAAANRLDPIAVPARLWSRDATLAAELDGLQNRRSTEQAALSEMQTKRRFASGDEYEALTRAIDAATDAAKPTDKRLAALTAERNTVVAPQLRSAAVVVAARDALRDLALRARGAGPEAAPGLLSELDKVMSGFRSFDASYRRFLFGDVPWRLWMHPLLNWALLIFITYLVLMTFNLLIYRQWSHNEKLSYPLAQLTMLLTGADAEGERRLPAVWKSGVFWAGAGVSVGVLTWNLLVQKGLIPGAGKIPLVFEWDAYIAGSFFKGLGPRMEHQVFFTLIGLTFLIPARISFSMWFFHLVYLVLLLVLVGLGLGTNEKAFPCDITLVLNYRTALGGGALLIFSAVTFWKCRQYLLCALKPDSLRGLEPPERRELRTSSVLFLAGSAALVATLTAGLGVNIFYAVLGYLMILITTIGLVRAVAEGGLLGFQCWFNPFHFVRSVFGMDRSWTAPSLFAPLVVYHYVLFWDIKTFIAPAMANALKVRDSLRMKRLRFHGALLAGIVAAFAVAIASHIILAYHRGADAMQGWFYTDGPKTYLFDSIKSMSLGNPVDTAGGRYWMLGGMVVMAVLIFFRQYVFWIPHPIGLIMWVNPIMRFYWFSILLGWLFKSMVSRYGNRHTYAGFRNFFLGLIVGEIVMCLFGVTLNRS